MANRCRRAISLARWFGAGVGLVAALSLAGPASADGGPHVAVANSGASTLTADGCAGCHRAHTAGGASLLAAPDEVALCLSCHGSSGAGATTDVVDGVVAGTTHGLRGGGFTNAVMDTAWAATAVSRPATSAHVHDGTTAVTAWGNGAIGSGPGQVGFTLTCAGCHNPHGNGSYRILRPIPSLSGATDSVVVEDEATKTYGVTSLLNRYFGQVYGDQAVAPQAPWEWMYSLDEWCVQCHTRYDAVESGTATTSSGDAVFTYRHMTRWPTGWINCTLCHRNDMGNILAPNPFGVTAATAHEPVCLTCHVAHGSAATMATYSATVPWPDGSTSPTGNARSSLLRLDNRAVCIGCHDPTR